MVSKPKHRPSIQTPGSIDYVIDGVGRRVTSQKHSSRRVTSVDRHLAKSRRALKRGCLGPSLFASLAQAVSALGKPLFIVIFGALIFAAENRSAAWFHSEPTQLGNGKAAAKSQTNSTPLADTQLEHQPIAKIEPNVVTDSVNAAVEIEPVKLELDSSSAPPVQPTVSREDAEQVSLVKFIAGLIAVYYPEIDNCGETARHIVELSDQAQMDPLYIASVIALESGFRSHAKSSVGALGLMQLIPSTAKEVQASSLPKAAKNATPKLTDAWTNIKLGIDYLKQLEHKYRGNRFMALAAYNWGLGNLDQAKATGGRIPGSVQEYANSILERTVRWQKHFKRASQSAEKILATDKPTDKTLLAEVEASDSSGKAKQKIAGKSSKAKQKKPKDLV